MKNGNNACMSFTNFIATYAWLVVGIIFLVTALLINQIRIGAEGETIAGFNSASIKAYFIMNLIFFFFSFAMIFFIVLFIYLLRTKTPKFFTAILTFPPNNIFASGLLAVVLLFLTCLFIGNAVFLNRVRKQLEEDPTVLPTSPTVAYAFFIVNTILAVIAPILAIVLIGLTYVQVRSGGKASKVTASKATASKATTATTATTTKGIDVNTLSSLSDLATTTSPPPLQTPIEI